MSGEAGIGVLTERACLFWGSGMVEEHMPPHDHPDPEAWYQMLYAREAEAWKRKLAPHEARLRELLEEATGDLPLRPYNGNVPHSSRLALADDPSEEQLAAARSELAAGTYAVAVELRADLLTPPPLGIYERLELIVCPDQPLRRSDLRAVLLRAASVVWGT